MSRTALALLAAALLVAGCGAKRQTTSSTTAATPIPIATETETPTPTPTATETATPTPTATATPAAKSSGKTLAVEADPSGQLAFTKTSLTAKAGKVTIDFKNSSPTPHNVAIRKGTGKPLVETAVISGKSTTSDVKLAPGTYEFYCSVPGHEEAGMKGTLTVK